MPLSLLMVEGQSWDRHRLSSLVRVRMRAQATGLVNSILRRKISSPQGAGMLVLGVEEVGEEFLWVDIGVRLQLKR